MNRWFKRALSGIATIAVASGGFLLGASTANADAPAASGAPGTITINGDGAKDHTFSAYLIAAYNADYTYTTNDDAGNLSLIPPSNTGDTITTTLEESTRLTDKSTGLTDINRLTTRDGSGWGFNGADSSTDVRKFAQTLAKDLAKDPDALGKPQTLHAGANTVTPEGLYLIIDDTKSTDGATSTISVPMIAASTFAKDSDHTSKLADGTVTIKNTPITVHKQVVNDSGVPNHTPSYNVGDTITFELSTIIPNFSGYAKDPGNPTATDARMLQLTDEFSKGLTFDSVTSVIVDSKPLKPDNDYTAARTTPAGDGGGTLVIDFAKLVNQYAGSSFENDLPEHYGATIKALVTAHLNKDAVIAATNPEKHDVVIGEDSQGNPNTVSVTFSNNPGDNNDRSTTPGDIVNVYSYKFSLTKTGQGNDASGLKGAKFTLYDDSGKYYLGFDSEKRTWTSLGTKEPDKSATTGVFTSDPQVDFKGLKQGTYTVHEVEAPGGYLSSNLPTFDFTIDATYNNDGTNTTEGSGQPSGDDTLQSLAYEVAPNAVSKDYLDENGPSGTVKVKNFTSITQLPLTGAAGIALFSVIGLALVFVGALFGLRARRSAHRLA